MTKTHNDRIARLCGPPRIEPAAVWDGAGVPPWQIDDEQQTEHHNRVLCGDCLAVLPTLPADRFNLIFADPPYNIGIDYGTGARADRLPADDYRAWFREWLVECCRVLHPAGSLWVLVSEPLADVAGQILTELLPRRNRIIWHETFSQYRADRFANGHRHLFWHVADPANVTWQPDEVRVPSARMLAGDKRAAGPRVPDDVWSFPRLPGNARERVGWHPCQLPETLLDRVVRCCTQPDDWVLDPFAGSGTTLRVAQRLGRRSVGIEKNPDYVRGIEKRLAAPWQRELIAR